MKAIDKVHEILNNPQQIVADWKAQGKKVVGYRCIYVPEEMIYAADMLPYPMLGTPESIGAADSYFQSNMCEFIRNIFDIALKGEFDFLDGLVLCNVCDGIRRLHDYWNAYINSSPAYLINNPQIMNSELSYKYCRHELDKFKQEMERLSGNSISEESLGEAIRLYNETRALLRELYSLRKESPLSFPRGEALNIVMASMFLPREESNRLLRQLLEEVKVGEEDTRASGPRILVTGSIIDNPALIELVEESGGTVVAEDLCTGLKYFWYDIKEDEAPLDAIARYNTERTLCACMHPSEARFDYLQQIIKEFDIDGIIYLNLKYCDPFLYEGVLFNEKLEAMGVPAIMLEVEHNLSGIGQLKTRIQAFIEMLV